jgi:hypothetical protein
MELQYFFGRILASRFKPWFFQNSVWGVVASLVCAARGYEWLSK